MSRIKTALDIDGVICDFAGGVIKRAEELGIEFLKSKEEWIMWDGHTNFSEVMKDAWLDADFWLSLKPLNSISFTPHMYITSRPIKSTVTQQWLDKHGFPKAKLITVSAPEEKIQHLINEDVDLLIDDLHTTVKAAIDANICAYLFAQHHQVGHDECKYLPKIYNLNEVNTMPLYIGKVMGVQESC